MRRTRPASAGLVLFLRSTERFFRQTALDATLSHPLHLSSRKVGTLHAKRNGTVRTQIKYVDTDANPTAVRERTIAVIGLGYVGLPLAVAAAEGGATVLGYDIDEEKIAALAQKRSPLLSPRELEAFEREELYVSHDAELLSDADVFIICVPTPIHSDYTPDITPLVEACQTVGSVMRPGSLVIVESTIHPGMSEELIIPILEQVAELSAGQDFSYAFCPERVNPGDATYSTKNIPRVIGALDETSMRRALDVYSTILDAPLTPLATLKEAEAVKMVENAFRDINIAFVNELARAFEKEGIDIVNVINGAATKPFGFMPHYPGCGVGGHCIPVDPYYLIEYGKRHGFTHELLMKAREVNNHMPVHTVNRLRQALQDEGHELAGARIALLGLSYKKNVGDLRESPALVIQRELEREGATVATYDPHVPRASTAASIEAALTRAVAVIVATDHDEFTELQPADLLGRGVYILIDGRNCLTKEAFVQSGITYAGIGR